MDKQMDKKKINLSEKKGPQPKIEDLFIQGIDRVLIQGIESGKFPKGFVCTIEAKQTLAKLVLHILGKMCHYSNNLMLQAKTKHVLDIDTIYNSFQLTFPSVKQENGTVLVDPFVSYLEVFLRARMHWVYSHTKDESLLKTHLLQTNKSFLSRREELLFPCRPKST